MWHMKTCMMDSYNISCVICLNEVYGNYLTALHVTVDTLQILGPASLSSTRYFDRANMPTNQDIFL